MVTLSFLSLVIISTYTLAHSRLDKRCKNLKSTWIRVIVHWPFLGLCLAEDHNESHY